MKYESFGRVGSTAGSIVIFLGGYRLILAVVVHLVSALVDEPASSLEKLP
jgi:hypothetical protein